MATFPNLSQNANNIPIFCTTFIVNKEVDKAYINSDATRRTEGQPLIIVFIYKTFHNYTLSLQWLNYTKLHNRKCMIFSGTTFVQFPSFLAKIRNVSSGNSVFPATSYKRYRPCLGDEGGGGGKRGQKEERSVTTHLDFLKKKVVKTTAITSSFAG